MRLILFIFILSGCAFGQKRTESPDQLGEKIRQENAKFYRKHVSDTQERVWNAYKSDEDFIVFILKK